MNLLESRDTIIVVHVEVIITWRAYNMGIIGLIYESM